jgi:two-component system cell cycle sensor histidine kinase/response regulator CckA
LPRWKKKRADEKHVDFLFEWVTEKDFFSDTADPDERTVKLLIEIQKRSLAEQVGVISWNLNVPQTEILYMIPSDHFPLHPAVQKLLLDKAYYENRTLFWEDLCEDPKFKSHLESSSVQTLIVHPLRQEENSIDALFILNHAPTRQYKRVLEFITFISPVLALSIQNYQLYLQLKHKNEELDSWIAHVESRIEEGTKKLLEREYQYHALFEATNDGIIVHDRDGRLVEANTAVCRLLDYEKKELVALNWNQLTINDLIEQQKALFEKVLSKEKVNPFETTLIRKDGSQFKAELSSRFVRFRGELMIQTVIRDISQKFMFQERLKETKERYQILVEASQVGVFMIHNGIIEFVNSVFEQFTGYKKEELIGRNFFDLIFAEDRDMISSRETQREKGVDVPDHYEVRFLQKAKTWCWGEVRASRIVLEGHPSILGNVMDITKRKQLEMKLIESQKMESIGTLAGGIAHDFNNLLGGILGYASLLLSDMPKDSPYYEDIHTIAETAKRAADLTNRLLAFARGGKYQVTSIKINEIATDVLGILSHGADKSIAFESFFSKNLWQIRGDRQQIHQALMNVCLNAVEAMPNGGKLTFSTDNVILDESFVQTQLGLKAGDYIRIQIADTGIGMDNKTKSRVFEPFFTTRSGQGGKGLGMSVVYGIVKNHEGTATIDSQPGKGTRVTIFLPKHIKSLESDAEPLHDPVEKRTILLVDDEEVIRQVGKRMLNKGGYEVIAVESGEEAIEIFRTHQEKIQLVLLDLVLPTMTGRETAKKLREIDKDIIIVFTSGYGLQDRPDLIKSGEEFFIQKPFQTEVLIKTLEDIIESKPENGRCQ